MGEEALAVRARVQQCHHPLAGHHSLAVQNLKATGREQWLLKQLQEKGVQEESNRCTESGSNLLDATRLRARAKDQGARAEQGCQLGWK